MGPDLPPLYGLAPLGAGTSLVEGLVSFITRICHRRLVRSVDVLDRILRAHAPAGFFLPRAALASFLNGGAARFDSLGEAASIMVSAVESVTLRTDLRSFTALPLAPVVDESERSVVVVARHRRWCRACFSDWTATGIPLYEPLLWRLRAVTSCPVHGTAFVDCCPRCGSRQGALAMAVPIGVCRGCGGPLHASSDRDVESSSAPDLRWAQSRARAIARMLAIAQRETPSRDGFARLLAFSLDAAGARALTRRQLALALAVPPPLFYAWSDALSFPSLAACADVCLQLGADPGEVILPQFDPRGRTWPPPGDPILAGVDDVWAFALRARECANERLHPRWAAQLDALASEPLGSGFASVASNLRAAKAHLEAIFPLRFARLREARARHEAAARADARARARVALEEAIAAGGAVTGFEAGRRARMNEADMGAHCPELHARLRELVAARIVSNSPALARAGRTALEAALRTPCGVTAAEVARRLGVTVSVLRCACPEAYRDLVALRREERRMRRTQIRSALKSELARPVPRGSVVLARALGTSLSQLQREPDLYGRLIEKRRVAGVKGTRRRVHAPT